MESYLLELEKAHQKVEQLTLVNERNIRDLIFLVEIQMKISIKITNSHNKIREFNNDLIYDFKCKRLI
jgi:hypothetical protein